MLCDTCKVVVAYGADIDSGYCCLKRCIIDTQEHGVKQLYWPIGSRTKGKKCIRWRRLSLLIAITLAKQISYSNTTVYYKIHESSECISVDCGVTNLIHDRRSCVDFTLEVRRMWLDVSTQAWTSQAWYATVGYETFYPLQTLLWR